MLTALETQVMATIPKENFYENGFDSTLWTDCFLDTVKDCTGIDPKQARAVLVTLSTKKYICVSGGRDGVITLLPSGVKWIRENCLVDESGRLLRK